MRIVNTNGPLPPNTNEAPPGDKYTYRRSRLSENTWRIFADGKHVADCYSEAGAKKFCGALNSSPV